MYRRDLWRKHLRQLTFVLGEHYHIGSYEKECKFIKVTPKGYNLLNIKTNKCILKRHIYKVKGKENTYWYNSQMVVSKVNIKRSFISWLNK